MAKFIPGPITAEIRNRLGGIVYTRSHHGPTTRSWVDPDQTETGPRAWSKWVMQYASIRWNTVLTNAQRLAWIEFARTHRQRAHDFYRQTLTGQQWHTKLNCFTSFWFVEYVDDPPPNLDVSDPGTVTQLECDITGQHLWLDCENWPTYPDYWYPYWTAPMNPGRMSNRQVYRQIWLIGEGDPRPFDFWTQYRVHFPAPTPGQRISLKLIALRRTTGATTAAHFATCLAY